MSGRVAPSTRAHYAAYANMLCHACRHVASWSQAHCAVHSRTVGTKCNHVVRCTLCRARAQCATRDFRWCGVWKSKDKLLSVCPVMKHKDVGRIPCPSSKASRLAVQTPLRARCEKMLHEVSRLPIWTMCHEMCHEFQLCALPVLST